MSRHISNHGTDHHNCSEQTGNYWFTKEVDGTPVDGTNLWQVNDFKSLMIYLERTDSIYIFREDNKFYRLNHNGIEHFSIFQFDNWLKDHRVYVKSNLIF